MQVWAAGTRLTSTPGRYHFRPDCWTTSVPGVKLRIIQHTFKAERDEVERRGWWGCPYCDPDETAD